MLDDAIKYAKMILTAEYGTVEVARVFLDKPATMGQRLARAKISKAGMPFEIPDGEAPTRIDLCEEAVFLIRLMVQLCPDTPEVASQLALILLIHSRRGARYNDGEYVPLADQDRALWDQAWIGERQALGLTRTESERVFLAARQGELGD